MDESLTRQILYQFGMKYFELQQGFAAIFNLCLKRGVFTEEQFHKEREFILSFPEMTHWANFLDSLKTSTAQADVEEALRKFEGPIQ